MNVVYFYLCIHNSIGREAHGGSGNLRMNNTAIYMGTYASDKRKDLITKLKISLNVNRSCVFLSFF